MTDTEINEAIAKACGAFTDAAWNIHSDGAMRGYPNYVADLNAMHEAEKTLIHENGGYYQLGGFGAYLVILRRGPAFAPECATARQRAEAFLRTLNLWREDTTERKETK